MSDIEMKTQTGQAADGELLAKLNEAVAAVNRAEQTVTTAQVELVSRSRTVGLLLLEAKKLHPAVKDFETFLKRVQGLKLSRAYDLLRLAGGRTTDEEIRKQTRDRVKKHRAKKLPKAKPAPLAKPETEPEKVSVTDPHVTETTEESTARRKAVNANLSLTPEEMAAKRSAHWLAEFVVGCRLYLPKITIEADRQKARLLVSELTRATPQKKVA
jgi:hypothetical protein